jgi:hypothetical protein
LVDLRDLLGMFGVTIDVQIIAPICQSQTEFACCMAAGSDQQGL